MVDLIVALVRTMRTHADQLPPEKETFLTRRELAARHKVSIETLKRRERLGLLPALRLGRGVRYRLSDILRIESEATTN